MSDCTYEPCVVWCLDTSCCDGWDDLDPDLQARASMMAWDLLKALTAGRVGSCPVVMRPCLQEPCDYCGGEWLNPILRNGRWYNAVCGTPKCSCAQMCEIVFPSPIADITEVLLDGIVLDPTLFRVDNGNRLVRTDGGCWPSCQRMDRVLGDVCTLGITYTPGVRPGPLGEYAAGVLACEFSKACTGSKCRLPSGITTVVRQGVSYQMSASLFPNGLTGIREVDTFISVVNPHGLKTPSVVWSPDLSTVGHRYTTWVPDPVVVP